MKFSNTSANNNTSKMLYNKVKSFPVFKLYFLIISKVLLISSSGGYFCFNVLQKSSFLNLMVVQNFLEKNSYG